MPQLGAGNRTTTLRFHWPGRDCVVSATCTHLDDIDLCEHMYGMQPIAGDAFPSDTGGGASRYVQLLSTAFSIQVQHAFQDDKACHRLPCALSAPTLS